MPEFAHIAQVPDLAATTGMAFPYDREQNPVAVMTGGNDNDTLAAAAGLIGKLTVMARHAFPIELVSNIGQAAGRDALFIGTGANLPPDVLGNVVMQATAGETTDAAAGASLNVDDWRGKIATNNLQSWLSGVGNWLANTFSLDPAAFSILPAQDEPRVLSASDGAFITQFAEPGTGMTWTVLGAQDGARLRNGANAMTGQENWEQIAGRTTIYQGPQKPLEVIDAQHTRFVQTVAPSFNNMRLVVTNWLSSRPLSYALGLIVAAIFLGLFTSLLLGSTGRSSRHEE